jgi:hypothetical protein
VATKKPAAKSVAKWEDLPGGMLFQLAQAGLMSADLNTPYIGPEPYTQAGASGLFGPYLLKDMEKNTDGVAIGEGRKNPDGTRASSRTTVLLSPKPDAHTAAHEMEHVLANQGLGSGSALNLKWDELVKDKGSMRQDIVKRIVEHAPYLSKTYGIDPKDIQTGYFSKNVLARPDMRNFLYEQMATLSAVEQATNRQLTNDPYVRQHIFKTPAERETYNALTGLRQSRLDPKDLPPYTRQPETRR